MVRPDLWILISFFLVIHTSSSTSTSFNKSYIVNSNGSTMGRPCKPYKRCARSTDGILEAGDSSILEANSSIMYGENLTSSLGNFSVGLFVRGNNTYLGTWYNFPTEVIVWVANRDSPIPSRLRENCSLVVADSGNAMLLDSNNHSYWSTGLNPSGAALTFLQILDDGNLVYWERGDRSSILWQSFVNPTDTFLPGMDISNDSVILTSWKGPGDPAIGQYSFKKGVGEESNEVFMYNSTASPYWGSLLSSPHPYFTPLLWRNLTNSLPNSLRLVMNATGSVQLWEGGKSRWSLLWAAPQDQCDLYDTCGSSGVCNAGNSVRCKCLPGYKPSDPAKWESEDFLGGCSKRTTDQCGDVFLSLPMINLPPHGETTDLSPGNESDSECNKECQGRCGCRAYSFDANQSRCLIWTDDLTHVEEEYYHADAHTLYIRLNLSDFDSGSRTCRICGTNVIPYPLSTGPSCGDLNYFNFECNTTNGQVYFKPPSGIAYKVSHINPLQRNFTLQLLSASALTDYKCDATNVIASKSFHLNESSPFNVTKCSVLPLMYRTVVEVEVSWEPPSSPACNSSNDCKDWPQTTCGWDNHRKKMVCMCANGFHWDPLIVNCTKDDHHKHLPLLIKVGVASAAGLCLLSIISFVIYLRRKQVTDRAGTADQFKTDEIEDIDLPFVDYQSILVATDNFSDAKKLGAGGFGPVYKGLLADGNEVAVKRLSATSLQGVQELRNEMIVIAKLQHRNLVRVVGYCIKEEEKILIYEYMPNKSLDSFLFDQAVSPLLDWTKRFNIILGIARGLLYLHQDSRLRIIHRDLKPSNILLDEELNPKISDFGLAKIVAGNEMAANTARVVGTYGYMSPEYALDGYFSVKSDVYSFGIIVFEVITGRRCTSLLQLGDNLVSLLGYAWTMWEKGEELEMTDKAIIDTCDSVEVKRCINVAFLCVQEDPSDRPTMSSALLMLGGDKVNLPYPKQPVFVARRHPLRTTSSSSKLGTSSKFELTTNVEGR